MSQETEWVLIGIDDKLAKKQGIPPRIPVPKGEFEGLAEKGMQGDTVRRWIKDFLTNSEPGKSGVWRKQNHDLVSKLEAFVDKGSAWEKAQKAFADGEYDKAMAALKRIVAMDPDDHAARMNLGSALANARQYADAQKHFKAVRSSFAGDADYHAAYAQILVALENRDEAINELVLALEAKPDHQGALDTLTTLGVLVAVYENPHDAASLTYVRADSVVDYLTGEWDKEPREPKFFLEQLSYHEREGRFAVALAAAERGAAAGAGERAELARISSLRGLGRLDEALALAQEYVAKAPNSAGAHTELSQCLGALGQAEAARSEVDEALRLAPGDQLALVLRFWPRDRHDVPAVHQAMPALTAFAEAHPEEPGVWRSLARAMVAIGREDEALNLFAKAVALAPSDDDLRAEYWSELGKGQQFEAILADAAKITDMAKRDWKLRWNEAEAYLGVGKHVEARAAFSAINFDNSLHVDVRKRAKRAVSTMDRGGGGPLAAT